MGPLNSILRVLLAIWVIGFLLISCAPALFGDGAVGFFGIVAGLVLLVPWLLGVVVLAIGVWLTTPRR